MTALPAPTSRPRRALRPIPVADGAVQAADGAEAGGSGVARPLAVDPRGALRLARLPWGLPTGSGELRVRGAVPADLAAVGPMHGRCSADTLLQRYLRGGRPPALAALEELLRLPLLV